MEDKSMLSEIYYGDTLNVYIYVYTRWTKYLVCFSTVDYLE